MAGTDPRITRAKRALAEGVKVAAEAKTNPELTRSTATRTAYKAKADAADKALGILSEKPKRR